MDDSSALLVVLSILMAAGCTLVLVVAMVGGLLTVPFVYRKTWLSYTEGRTVAEAYEAVAEGATTGVLQVRPASYLYTDTFPVSASPEKVQSGITGTYTTVLTQVLIQDVDGVAVNARWPAELGAGWIIVFLVRPTEEGSEVAVRARTTQWMVPVLTFFLSLQLRLHLRRTIRAAAE